MSAKANTRPPDGYEDYVAKLKKQKQAQQDEGASAQGPSTTCEEAQPARDESAPAPPATRDEAPPDEGKSAQDTAAISEEDSDEDVPLDILRKIKQAANKQEMERMVAKKIASRDREASSRDVYGVKRPAEKKPLTIEEVEKARIQANRDVKAEFDRVVLGLGGAAKKPTKKEKAATKREQAARALIRYEKQDQFEGYRSCDDESDYDDINYGAVPDKAEIKKDGSGNSIHKPPAHVKRISQAPVKLNPDGDDSVVGGKIDVGFRLMVGLKGMGGKFDGIFSSEVYVSFDKRHFEELSYGPVEGVWRDGSRNRIVPVVCGFSVHNTKDFIIDLQTHLSKVLGKICSYETAKVTLETHMKKKGVHSFVHGQMVIFLYASGEVYEDKALKIEIIEEEPEDDSEDEDVKLDALSKSSHSAEGTNSESNSSVHSSSDSSKDEDSDDDEEDDDEDDDESDDDESDDDEDEVVVMQEGIAADSEEDNEEDKACAANSDGYESDEED